MKLKNILLFSLVYTFSLCLVLSTTAGFPEISQRDVRVHLNILNLKHTDYARSHMEQGEHERYEMGGGFYWQNRILVPLIIFIAKSALEQLFPYLSADLLGARVVYLIFLIIAIFFMYLILFKFLTRHFKKERKDILLASSVFSLLLYLIVLYSPRMQQITDYLGMILFMLIVSFSLERKFLACVVLTIIQSTVRESSLFFGVAYFILNFNPKDKFNIRLITQSTLLFLIGLITVLGIRAYFLGGLQYTLGIGIGGEGTQAYLPKILTHLYCARIRPLTASSWFVIILMLAVSLANFRKISPIDRRLVVFGAVVALNTVFFAGIQEARVLLPFVIIMLMPFVRSMLTQSLLKVTRGIE